MVVESEDHIMEETFGQRLSRLRKEKGLTQEDIAKRIIISPQAVSKWENDISSPDILVLSSLADILGVSVDELLGRQEENKTEEKETVEEKKEEDIKEGIRLTDDDGSSVTINKEGVTCIDENGHKVKIGDHFKDKGMMIIDIVEGVLFALALIAYILLGSLLGMWINGWIFLFVPGILCSIARCIYKKNANKFNMTFTACFIFFFVCLFIPGMSANLWHPMWTVFLAIPIYHSIMASINKVLGKKDDENDD